MVVSDSFTVVTTLRKDLILPYPFKNIFSYLLLKSRMDEIGCLIALLQMVIIFT